MDIQSYSKALLSGDFEGALKIKRDSIPEKLYKYIPLGQSQEEDSKRIKTLAENRLWLSPVSAYNDPYELQGLYIDENKIYEAGYDAKIIARVREVFDSICKNQLVCCFSAADYRAMPMWAYYANCSKGLCIEYSVINPSPLCEVFYEPKPQEVTKTITNLLLSALNRGIGALTEDKNRISMEILRNGAYIKHSSWKHEKEYRISIPIETDRGRSFLSTDLGLKATHIRLGIQCSEENEAKIKDVAHMLKVQISKMRATEDSFFAEETVLD